MGDLNNAKKLTMAECSWYKQSMIDTQNAIKEGKLKSLPVEQKDGLTKHVICNQYNFVKCDHNRLGQLLKQFSKLLSGLGACTVIIIGRVVYKKSMIIEIF